MAMVKKPKLLHITSSLLVGGAERVLCTLAKGLQQEFDQTVIYIHDGPLRTELNALGVRTIAVQGLFFRYDPWFFMRLYQVMRAEQPDLVHTLLWAANVAGRLMARLLRTPVVSAYHNNITQDGLLRSCLDRLTIGQAQAIVAVSKQVARGIQHRSPHTQPVVIPNGIALQPAACTTSRAALGIAADAWLVGAVGRFVPLKRFDVLLDAMAKLHADGHTTIHLLLIGYGPLEHYYRERIQALGIADKVTLVINRPAADYMHLMDVFVQPSGLEGISLALLEAMAHAKFCIVMPDDAVHPVITHGVNGLVVRGGSVAALAEAIDYAYNERDMCQVIAQRALQAVNTSFSADRMVAEYLSIFKRLLQG